MEGQRNLAAEAPDDDFDKYLLPHAKLERDLSRIEIECGNRDEKVKFYGSLPLMLAPTIYADVDGSITGLTGRYIKPTGGRITALSPYGIRTVPHPLYTYIEPAA